MRGALAGLLLLASLGGPASAQPWAEPLAAGQLIVHCWPADRVIAAIDSAAATLVFTGDQGGPTRFWLFGGPQGWIFLAGDSSAPGILCPILWNLKGPAE